MSSSHPCLTSENDPHKGTPYQANPIPLSSITAGNMMWAQIRLRVTHFHSSTLVNLHLRVLPQHQQRRQRWPRAWCPQCGCPPSRRPPGWVRCVRRRGWKRTWPRGRGGPLPRSRHHVSGSWSQSEVSQRRQYEHLSCYWFNSINSCVKYIKALSQINSCQCELMAPLKVTCHTISSLHRSVIFHNHHILFWVAVVVVVCNPTNSLGDSLCARKPQGWSKFTWMESSLPLTCDQPDRVQVIFSRWAQITQVRLLRLTCAVLL